MKRLLTIATGIVALAGTANGLLDGALVQTHLPFHTESKFQKEMAGKLIHTGENGEFFTSHTTNETFIENGLVCNDINAYLRRYSEDGSLLWQKEFGFQSNDEEGDRYFIYPQAIHTAKNRVYVIYHRSWGISVYDGECLGESYIGTPLYFEERRLSDGKLLKSFKYDPWWWNEHWLSFARLQVANTVSDPEGNLYVGGTLSQFVKPSYVGGNIHDNPRAGLIIKFDLNTSSGSWISEEWYESYGPNSNYTINPDFKRFATDLQIGSCDEQGVCDLFMSGLMSAEKNEEPYPAVFKIRSDTGDLDPTFGNEGIAKLGNGEDFEESGMKLTVLNSGRVAVAIPRLSNNGGDPTLNLRILSPKGKPVYATNIPDLSYALGMYVKDGINVMGVKGGDIFDYEWVQGSNAIVYGRWDGSLQPKTEITSYEVTGAFDTRTSGSASLQIFKNLLIGNLTGKVKGIPKSKVESPHMMVLRLNKTGDLK